MAALYDICRSSSRTSGVMAAVCFYRFLNFIRFNLRASVLSIVFNLEI